ncbi:protein FAN-like [Anneissia japonica]|uniref:protein FAN-like n=1 Tax=Anneissia japonica TaxID=1529436 RepID=UPI001425508D|nr:protein FAN-like [Anneissia japonica]
MAFVDAKNDCLQKERFSLLLLEPGEIYLEDYSVYYYRNDLSENEAIQRKVRGRLKVCSKSIVFTPQDSRYPIVKFILRNCDRISRWTGALLSKLGNNVIAIESRQTVEMKHDDVIGPYHFNKENSKYMFSLNFVSPEKVLPQMCQLHRASQLTPADQNAMVSTIIQSLQNRVSFDTSWLGNLYEQLVMETSCDRISPLVVNPGRIMLTSSRLYFQPFNNLEPDPVTKINLSQMKRIVKRRFLLRQVGLEIFCSKDSLIADMFIVLPSPVERDQLYNKMIEQDDVSLMENDKQNMLLKWQSGSVSNLDYLLYLNSEADRSFNDFTQYPVFPWIIADYTSPTLDLNDPKTFRDLSKPIGALDAKRLARFKERCADMPEPRFLYGSHYSTPGYVLYYLVRVAPEYMLCLQSGRFDQPDRLFNCIQETWGNVLSLPSDVKELIPEFYLPEYADFLVNKQSLNLGVRQDGSKVNNVELPPWATDAKDFCTKCREALESDYVSTHLHKWIDLIFGFKQRGKEAEKYDNLFYYLTYEGAVDIESIRDPNERAAIKAQIMEFGQTPRQLFTKPHPTRFPSAKTEQLDTSPENGQLEVDDDENDEEEYLDDDVIESEVVDQYECVEDELPQTKDWSQLANLLPYQRHKLHRDTVTSLCLSADNKHVYSVSQAGVFKVYSFEEQQQVRGINLSSMPLSSIILLPNEKLVLIASWDDSVYLYSMEYGRVVSQLTLHDDAVSAMCWQDNMLFTGSWDSTIKVWAYDPEADPKKLAVKPIMELDHESGVSCIHVNSNNSQILSGTKDGIVYLWDVECQSVLRQTQSHVGAVTCVKFSIDGQRMVSCGEDCYMRVVDINTGTEILAKDLGQNISCLCWPQNYLIAGGQGELLVWDMAKAQLVTKIKAHGSMIASMYMGSDLHLVTGGEDRNVILWKRS